MKNKIVHGQGRASDFRNERPISRDDSREVIRRRSVPSSNANQLRGAEGKEHVIRADVRIGRRLGVASAATLGLWMSTGFAHATDGYVFSAPGIIQQAYGGAGVAYSQDAAALAINPAGLVNVGRQVNLSVGFLSPFTGYNATGTGFIAPGNVESNQNIFPTAAGFYSMPIDGDSSIAIGLYGEGGLGSSLDPVNTNTGTKGVFGAGGTGVNLLQEFISAGYAHRIGNLSIGVAPIFMVQRFAAWGLAPFAAFSTAPADLTNNHYGWGVGVGGRAGAELTVAPGVRLGIAGMTPFASSKISSYRGLLPSQGTVNPPPSLTAGVSWDASPTVTLMFDYKRIFYSATATIGDPSTIPPLLGTASGPGFGWRDVNVFNVAGEWRLTPKLSLRAGYAYSTNPVNSRDVVFNILAPAVMTNHISAGGGYKITENSTIDVAATFEPRNTLTGAVSPAFGGGNVTLSSWVIQATAGYTYRFDTLPTPIVARY